MKLVEDRKQQVAMSISSSSFENPRVKSSLWLLAFGNFLIGTSVLMPAAMLADLSTSFKTDVGTVGHLLLVTGLIIGIGAPILAALSSKLDRRLLLAGVLLLNAAGHLASVISQSFPELVFSRFPIAIAAAIFSPQAAAAVTLIVQPEKRDSAVAFVFVGWSAAMVVGVPVSGLISQGLGWQSAYVLMAGLSILGALFLWATLPQKLYVKAITLSAWRSALKNPVIVALLLVTFLSLTGQFAIFSYLSPLLAASFSAGTVDVAFAFAVAGATGVAGNIIASRLAVKFSAQALVVIALLLMATGAIILNFSGGVFALGLFAIAIWGLGSFSSTSLQQGRLATTAPQLASATISLNTSSVYLGQAAGVTAGGFAFATGNPSAVTWVALLPLVAAIALSTAIWIKPVNEERPSEDLPSDGMPSETER
jgi:predicted MFS family arabinose efflux permease